MNARIIKRQIQQELSSEETLSQAGVAVDLEMGRLILALASRMIVNGNATYRTGLARAVRIVGRAVSIELVDEDGFVIAPLADAPPGPLTPSGRSAGKALNVTSSGFNQAWDDGPVFVTSCLPLEVVLAFLPATAWPYVAAFIKCGPHEARLRLSAAASSGGETMAWKSLDAQVTPVQTMMEHLVKLLRDYETANHLREHTGRVPLPVPRDLRAWTFAPRKLTTAELKAKARGGRKLPTSAIPEELIKDRLRELARAAEWGRWEPDGWPLHKNWRALKRLTIFAVLAVVAPRIEHLGNLLASDVVLSCRFRDGTTGAAILFRGGDRCLKNRPETYEYAVRLPDDFRDILVAWLTCNGNAPLTSAESGDTRRARATPQPLFPARKRRHPDDQQAPHDSLGGFVVGRVRTARSHAVSPLIDDPARPGEGFQAHRFRSTLTQGLDRVMKQWRDGNVGHPLAGYSEKAAAELALDHTPQDLGYRDFRDADGTPTARFEQIVSLGIELWWSELWGEGPYVRRGLDPDSILSAHEKVQLLAAQIEMAESEAAILLKEARLLVTRALTQGDGSHKMHALLQSNAVRDQRDDVLARLDELRGDLASAQAERSHACETEAILPDHQDGQEYADSLAAALATVRSEPPPNTRRAQPVLAHELTTADVAELFGVTTQQVGRWRRGESSPPVDPAAWVVHNKKDFRLPASAIEGEALRRIPSRDPRGALDTILAARAARGFARSTTIGRLTAAT